MKNHTLFKLILLHEFGSFLPNRPRAAGETFRSPAVPVSERFCPDRWNPFARLPNLRPVCAINYWQFDRAYTFKVTVVVNEKTP